MDALREVYNDGSYRTFCKIAQEIRIPDFVKEGSAEGDFGGLNTNAFGDPGRRKYPLDNRSNTWLSREYFARERCQYHEKMAALIQSRIDKAAELWGLEPSEKIAAQAPEYHVVEAKHAGKRQFAMQVASPTQWKEAAEQLHANRARMTYEMRRTFARDLLAAPDKFHCELPAELGEYLEKAAGFGMATDSRLMQAITARVAQIHRAHPELSAKLVKLAQELRGMDHTPATLHKVAGMLDIVDRAVELHRYYGHGHDTPEESVFAVTEKSAREFCKEALRLSTGDVVGRSELLAKKAQVDSFFQDYLGEIPYKSDEEMTQVVASLPRPDSAALLNTVKLTTMRG